MLSLISHRGVRMTMWHESARYCRIKKIKNKVVKQLFDRSRAEHSAVNRELQIQ